jgi:hypothetical protein
MSFKIDIRSLVRAKIASWNIPDSLLVDIYLTLSRDLSDNPAARLERTQEPFDGLLYRFSRIDPANRLSLYRFVFQPVYSQDEESLIVVRGGFAHELGI